MWPLLAHLGRAARRPHPHPLSTMEYEEDPREPRPPRLRPLLWEEWGLSNHPSPPSHRLLEEVLWPTFSRAPRLEEFSFRLLLCPDCSTRFRPQGCRTCTSSPSTSTDMTYRCTSPLLSTIWAQHSSEIGMILFRQGLPEELVLSIQTLMLRSLLRRLAFAFLQLVGEAEIVRAPGRTIPPAVARRLDLLVFVTMGSTV